MEHDHPTFPVARGRLYSLRDFQAATGLGRTSLREARRKGLLVQYVHGRAFILGDDWLDYVMCQGRPTANTPDGGK